MKRLYQATRRAPGADRCELCASSLMATHDHLYEPRARMVRCSCRGCALLVPTGTALYRLVPKRFERLALDTARWLGELGVPVGAAAVIVRDDGRTVVGFPGPAGLVESELDAGQAARFMAELPAPLVPEVEAIVLSTLPGGGAWLTGIDVVFEMVAELRASWRGMTGGPDAPAALARVLASYAGASA